MQRRAPHPARGFHLPVREVVGIQQPQGFRHTFLQILAVFLERLGAADIDLPQVKRRFALHDPMRQRHPRPARPCDSDRVIARRDPVAAQFGGLAQIIAVIGGKAFRPVEKRMNPRRLKQRHPVHGVF